MQNTKKKKPRQASRRSTQGDADINAQKDNEGGENTRRTQLT